MTRKILTQTIQLTPLINSDLINNHTKNKYDNDIRIELFFLIFIEIINNFLYIYQVMNFYSKC